MSLARPSGRHGKKHDPERLEAFLTHAAGQQRESGVPTANAGGSKGRSLPSFDHADEARHESTGEP
jgi:hypothetical protein